MTFPDLPKICVSKMAYSIQMFIAVFALLTSLSALQCSCCSCVEGPPLPDKPFITVWNTPTDKCKSKWNVTLDFNAFDFVVNREQTWCGEYIVIFYSSQLGLFPYFDSSGKAVNGGLPQVEFYPYFLPRVLYGLQLPYLPLPNPPLSIFKLI